ncbi:hypothetical protein Tco_0005902 [Tanacetum coccineum]
MYMSVSKPWRSFIDSSEFIAGYGARDTQPQSLLLRDKYSREDKYVSLVDDESNDTLTQQQQDFSLDVPDVMKHTDKEMLVVWNPSLKKSVVIALPDPPLPRIHLPHDIFGFAVSPVTNDPTIVMISYPNQVEIPVCGVWKIEHDESFTNLFTISTPDYTINNILGFRKNGEHVMETQKEDEEFAALEVYDPGSERISNLGIYGEKGSFFMDSYKETLLLLNHSNGCVYGDDGHIARHGRDEEDLFPNHGSLFIESSEFIACYRARKMQPHNLLLRYTDDNYQPKYLSINNVTLTQQQDLAPNVSALMKQQNDTVVIGYSRGLLCLFAFDKWRRFSGGTGMLVLWNPSLRRSVGILESGYFGVFGFTVCPVTNEPTIVKISFPWKVHIFTLSSKKWTEIVMNQLNFMMGRMLAKEFKAIDLPDKITTPFTSPVRFILSKLKGSIVVIVPHREVKVWKMEPDCSFMQLLTINTPDSYISNIAGFRKNGDLLVEKEERRGRLGFYGEARESALEIYDPCSQDISNLGFSGQNGSFFVRSYMETLHLFDHSDSCVYPGIN